MNTHDINEEEFAQLMSYLEFTDEEIDELQKKMQSRGVMEPSQI